jgi:hypothetical protein
MPSQVKKGRKTDKPEAKGAVKERENEKRNIADN